MIPEIIAACFPVMWEAENRPIVSLLRRSTTNNPQSVSDINRISPYTTLAEDVPCLFAGGPTTGNAEDDTTRTDTNLFIRETDIEGVTISQKIIFKYENRLYRLTDTEPNYIFGLIEFDLMRAD